MDILQSPIHDQQRMMSAATLRVQAVERLGFNTEE